MKNNYSIKLPVFLLSLVIGLSACEQKTTKQIGDDTFDKGKATFVVDESFAPIIGQEEYVYKSRNPGASPEFLYRTENKAINLLLNDSVRAAIIARELDTTERGIILRRGLQVEVYRFAVDAVALIVNKSSTDTTMTVARLKMMLNGQGDQTKTIVFDNPNSSLVRYLKDFAGSKGFTQKNIYALKSNKEVLKYVSEHPDALGITGFSWVNDPDKDIEPFVKNVQIVGVKDEGNKQYPNQYFKPSQESLVLKQYPLSRGLYMVNTSSKVGLATGFTTFLVHEVGQRIILKSGLLPDSIPTREINLKSN
jgi:phosphate transport system substrate-binding protein